MDFVKQWAKNKIIAKVNAFVESAFFPLLLGVAALLLYVLNLPIVTLALLAVCGVYICLFAENMRAGLAVLTFAMITFRYKDNGAAYLSTGAMVVYAVLGLPLLLSAVYRLLFRRVAYKKKWGLLSVFCLGFSFLLGGLFTKYYTGGNFALAIGLAGSVFLTYAFFSFTLEWKEDSLLYFARLCAIIVCMISIEVGEFYLRVYEKGTPLDWVWKERIILGWSISNMVGETMAILFPAIFFLIYKEKKGYLYWIVVAVGLIGIYFTYSRSALLWSGLATIVYSLVNCFIGEYKKIHRIVVASAIALVLAVVLALGLAGYLKGLLRFFLETGTSDRKRLYLWEYHLKLFKESPILGVGFKAFHSLTQGREHLAHNNLLQVLASTGVVGFLLYIFHRLQTLYTLFQKKTAPRFFVGGCLLVALAIGLFSSAFFHTYFLCYYGVILLILEKSLEEKE